MYKIDDIMTYTGRKSDEVYLETKLLPVNIRLFHSNERYKLLIESICIYFMDTLYYKFEDYAPLKGVSGANLGIPFNIIAIKDKDEDNGALLMLNPEIILTFPEEGSFTPSSNCGSVRLKKPIENRSRWNKIKVCYHDIEGVSKCKIFTGSVAYTIQHEIEHNQGILIID